MTFFEQPERIASIGQMNPRLSGQPMTGGADARFSKIESAPGVEFVIRIGGVRRGFERKEPRGGSTPPRARSDVNLP
jgi:hypothetical protein